MSDEADDVADAEEGQAAAEAQLGALGRKGKGKALAYMPGVKSIEESAGAAGSDSDNGALATIPAAPAPVSPLEYAEAGGAGLLRGASFGLSDPALIKSGLTTSEKLRDLKAKAPLTSGGTEFAGNIGSIVGAEALTAGLATPELGVAEAGLGAGEVAAEAAAKAAAETAAKATASVAEKGIPAAAEVMAAPVRVAGSFATEAAKQAAIGAGLGAGNQISEDALGDKETTAESLLASGLMGGIVGVGTAGLLHGVGALAKPALEKLSAGADTLSEKIDDLATKMGANPGKALQKGADDLTSNVQGIADARAKAGKIFHGADQDGVRYQEAEKLTEGMPTAPIEAAAKTVTADLDSQASTMADDLVNFKAPAQKAQRVIEAFKSDMANAGDATDMLSAARDAGRRLRDLRSAVNASTDFEKGEAVNYLRDMESTVKEHMTNPDVFGAAGDREASVNQTLARGMDSDDELFASGLAKKSTQKGVKGYEVEFRPNAMKSLAKGLALGTEDAKAKLATLTDWADAGKDFGAQVQRSLSGVPSADLDGSLKQIVLGQAKQLSELQGKTAAVTSLQEAMQAAKPGRGILSSIAKNYLGERAGDIVANPAEAASTLAEISGKVSTVSSKIAKGMGAFVNAPMSGELSSVVATDTLGSSSWSGKRQVAKADDHEGYKARRGEILALAQNPDQLHARLVAKTGAIHAAAPVTSGLVAMKVAQGVQHLAQNMPTHQGSDLLVAKDDPQPLSDTERGQLEDRHRVVQNPLSVIKSLKAGTLSSTEIQTLKAVYPKLYQQMASQLAGAVANSKTPIPYAKRLQIAQFLGQPTDTSLLPQNVAMLQQGFAGSHDPGPQAGQGAPHKPARNNATKVGQMKTSQAEMTPFQKVAQQ